MSSYSPKRVKVTVRTLRRMKENGDKIAMLTAYDASFAAQLDAADVDVVLVGDSLGNVIQGCDSTLPVTMDDMVYHTRIVARGCQRPMLIVDMPFMSYWSVETALQNAARLMQEGGAHMVKLECTAGQEAIVAALANEGIPVCAHLGLRPQSVHKLGGYRVQGRERSEAGEMLEQAHRLEAAGADMLVLEAVPAPLAAEVTRNVSVPVIGIGAGPQCDGQVLVLYDVLGITAGKTPRFARNFLRESGSISAALSAYVQAVKSGAFPGAEHTFE
ncbi:MAG TPA: 3-methyl-2-oxobutanoate hydroxymethyltransferase [Gammaproteobacteria bacterium]